MSPEHALSIFVRKYSDLELAPGRPDFIRTGCRGITGPVPPPLLMEVTQSR
jgi:hypothetical protein